MDNVLADIAIDDPTAHVNGDVEMADVAPKAVHKQKKRRHSDTNGNVNGTKSKKSKK